MDLAGYLKKAIEIVKLNGETAAAVGRDELAFGPGLVFVAASGVATGAGNLLLHRGSVGGIVGGAIGAIAGYFVGVGILHLVATLLFGAKGDYLSLFRAESMASILGWAMLVPFVGVLAGLWHFPVSVVILQNVYGMPREKAIATVGVIFGVFLLLGFLMFLMMGALFAGFLGGLAAR
jgi:hypothetical protein